MIAQDNECLREIPSPSHKTIVDVSVQVVSGLVALVSLYIIILYQRLLSGDQDLAPNRTG